jgi:hypothetical protein
MFKLTFSQLPTGAKGYALKMWLKYNNPKGKSKDEVLKMLNASKWLYNRKGEMIHMLID